MALGSPYGREAPLVGEARAFEQKTVLALARQVSDTGEKQEAERHGGSGVVPAIQVGFRSRLARRWEPLPQFPNLLWREPSDSLRQVSHGHSDSKGIRGHLRATPPVPP